MLHCRACIRDCIRTLFSHLCTTRSISTPCPPHLLTRRVIPCSIWLRRGYATEASLVRRAPGVQPSLSPQRRDHTPYRPASRPSQFEPHQKTKLELEVRWLKDPVKLAASTVESLRKDNFWKALEVVRLASKNVECTVSWNHLIDYQMSKAKVADAVKLYNEVGSCLRPNLRVLKPDPRQR